MSNQYFATIFYKCWAFSQFSHIQWCLSYYFWKISLFSLKGGETGIIYNTKNMFHIGGI